jgi:hypothetical protein
MFAKVRNGSKADISQDAISELLSRMRYGLVLPILWLILASGCVAKSPDAGTRDNVISSYTAVLKSWDKDGDRKLSRAELAAMWDEFGRRLKQQSPDATMTVDLQKQRQEFLAFYASQDTDHDSLFDP